MTKHTPGPWTLERDASRLNVRIKPTESYAFSLGDEANARLIAAAPDMLEALKGALAWCSQDVHNDDCMPNQAMLENRVAELIEIISKATGIDETELALRQPEPFDTAGE